MSNPDKQLDLRTEKLEAYSEPKKEPWHPERARMALAYWVLGGILLIFFLSIVSNLLAHLGWIDETLSLSLFELCKTSLLPIVTLILGFYFSKM